MTKDDIIRMAREAGFRAGHIEPYSGGPLPFIAPTSATDCMPELERFAALVAAAERNRIARAALTPSVGAESRGCGSCKHWINERRTGDKEGSGSCGRVPMQWQAEPDDALAFVADGELYFAQLRTMPSFFCAHFEAVTPSAENSSTSPVERAAGPTASDLP